MTNRFAPPPLRSNDFSDVIAQAAAASIIASYLSWMALSLILLNIVDANSVGIWTLTKDFGTVSLRSLNCLVASPEDIFYCFEERIPGALQWPTVISAGIAALTFVWVFVLASQPHKIIKFISGKSITRSHQDLKERGSKSLVKVHPELSTTEDRIRKPQAYIGRTGGGKTTSLDYLIDECAKNNLPRLIYDGKGDETAKWMIEGTHLIAPWDSRSSAIDLRKDIRTIEESLSFVKHLIPSSSGENSFFAQAAQTIGACTILHATRDRSASFWGSLRPILNGTHEEKAKLVNTYLPNNLSVIWEKNRTTHSTVSTADAFLRPLATLAKAWESTPPDKYISIREWLHNGQPHQIILQGNSGLSDIAYPVARSIFQLLFSNIGNPQLKESKSRCRWIFCDELLQLGKIDELQSLFQLSRSKGIRLAVGFQDLDGLRDVYGQHKADSILANLHTIYFFGNHSPATNEWITKVAGDREFWLLEQSKTHGPNGLSFSQHYVRQSQPVANGAVLDTLGIHKVWSQRGEETFARGLVLGYRDHVGILDWPSVERELVAEPHELAEWLDTTDRNLLRPLEVHDADNENDDTPEPLSISKKDGHRPKRMRLRVRRQAKHS